MSTFASGVLRRAWPACGIALLAGTVNGQAASPCAGKPMCASVTEFVASITDFRTSVSGYDRLVSAVMHFENRTTHPLILGYLPESGIVTDDQGNRYVLYNNSVRGMGAVTASTFDPKFVLQPGEASDARFEFAWRPGHQVIGTSFEMDVAIREILPLEGNQFKLGKEHALHFDRLAGAVAGAPTVVAAQPGASAPATTTATVAAGAIAPPASPAAAPSEPASACGTTPHCYPAGPFTAQVVQLTASPPDPRYHVLRLNVKFKNVSTEPIILAYHTGSGVIVDNYGNRYTWGRPGTHDQSASGIGVVEGTRADPQFVLRPGESRAATFQLTRYNPGHTAIGTGFNYDVVIEQLGILPSNQIQSLRQYSVSFTDLSANGPSAAADPVKAASSLVDALRKKLGKP